jgi:DnaJ-class molecular chaperone
MVKDTKLYDILEIPPTSTENEINKAYYKLSKIWHPDKNAHRLEEATKKFQEMNEAKNILSDPEKREMYDKFGITQDQQSPGGANFDPSDIFGSMFGGMGGMNMPGMPGMPNFFNQQRKQQEDCVVEHVAGLDDLYNNRTVNIRYKHKVYCSKCNATGSKDGKASDCSGCGGKGQKVRVIRQGNMIQQMVGACDECNGSGEKISKDNQCSNCLGNKNLLKETMFEFTLNKNMQNNQKILVNDKGHHFKNSKTNLIIIIKEQPHPIFKRQGNDLHMEIKLRLFQSLYGFTKMITHLDGRNIMVKHEKMIRNMKTLFKVKNEGMNSTGQSPGHLYIHISTCMPKIDKLEEQENLILKKLLVKAHLSEYQKEQNINKNADKLEKSIIEELDDTDDENDENDDSNQHGNGGPGVQGVQCAQQ